jgi:hypothetical protein
MTCLFGLVVRERAWTMNGATPRIIALADADRKDLDDVFAQDKEACRLYIELRLLPRHGNGLGKMTDPASIRRELEELGYLRDSARTLDELRAR